VSKSHEGTIQGGERNTRSYGEGGPGRKGTPLERTQRNKDCPKSDQIPCFTAKNRRKEHSERTGKCRRLTQKNAEKGEQVKNSLIQFSDKTKTTTKEEEEIGAE